MRLNDSLLSAHVAFADRIDFAHNSSQQSFTVDDSRKDPSDCLRINRLTFYKLMFLATIRKMKNSSYRPEIDGLRAIAVLGVIVYHSGFGVAGGYVGVDVFFVISGFLITGIILKAQEQNRFSLLEFWERRLRRIFPALTAMVLTVLTVSCFVMLPQDFAEVGKSSVAQTLFVANVFFWQDTNYFAGPAELKPLMHTWSLAVEEQFYVVLPVLLIVLKNESRQRVFHVLALVTILSFLASVYAVAYHSGAAFFLLPTRAWELCFGCLLAAWPRERRSRPKTDQLIAVVGMVAVLMSMFLLDHQTPFPGLAAVPAVAGTVAIIYATEVTRDCLVGRLLALKPLVFVGQVSYSLYLWHWPVLVFFRYVGGHVTLANVWVLALSVGLLSVISWRFIEQPFRTGLFYKRRRTVFVSSFVISLACLGMAAFVVDSDGLKSRFQGQLLTLVEDTQWRGLEYRLSDDNIVQRDKLPPLGISRTKTEDLDFVLWGDSHGMVMSSLFNDVATELGLRGVVIARAGRIPLPNTWNVADTTEAEIQRELSFGRNVLTFLANQKPDHLFLVSRWSAKCEGMSATELAFNPAGTKNAGMVVDAEVVDVSPENCANAISRQLVNLIQACEKLGITVWVVKQVPESGEAHPAKDLFLREGRVLLSQPAESVSVAEHELRQQLPNRIFNSLAVRNLKVNFLDPSPYFFEGNQLLSLSAGDRAYYRDDDHLTRWGLERLRPLIVDAMAMLVKN